MSNFAIISLNLPKITSMLSLSDYQNIISEEFSNIHIEKHPKSLYEPIDYILSLGGKRIRPVLTLMAADIFDGDYKNFM